MTKIDRILWHPLAPAAVLAWYGYRILVEGGSINFLTVAGVVVCVAWMAYEA